MGTTFNYNDGGRSKYFQAQHVGDCVVRATAIASGRDYKEVYNLYASNMRKGESPRNGVSRNVSRKVIDQLGGVWHSCMTIGSGCTVHLKASELPKGRLICSCSGHYTAVIDGVINDTYDPSRGGTRCVYGYWIFK